VKKLGLNEIMVSVILGQYTSFKPRVTYPPAFREDDPGITIFDPMTLKTVMVDKNAAEMLKMIDGKSDILSIAHRFASLSGLHPIMASFRTLQYLANFQQNGFISLPATIKVPGPAAVKNNIIFTSPILVSWEVTKACNLNCSHCASQTMEGREIDTWEGLELIEHLHDLGVFILSFSGGEPFIRPDIFRLLERARELDIQIGLTTNGILLDEETVQRLSVLEPFNVHISIDGVGEVHDSFRNRTGVFDIAIRSLGLLKQYRVPCGITTSLTKRNFSDLENIKEFVIQNDIRSWEIFFAIPVGNLDKNEALDEAEFMELAARIEAIRKELVNTKVFVGDSLGYFGSACIRDEEWNGCTAGISHCAIDAYGNVKGCPVQPPELIEGNIRDSSLGDIWRQDSAFQYNRRDVKLEGYCSRCRHKKVCRAGCKTSAFHITGDIRENRMCLYFLEHK
jgi:radical SAM protein with 4Fe4S-binding SPASM domain